MQPSPQELTRHDPLKARQAQRAGREKGVRIFVSAAELRAAGIDPDGPAPKFRVWARRRGSLLVRLYVD
jgi:hypothetical protein